MKSLRSLLSVVAIGLIASPVDAAIMAYYSFNSDFTDTSGNANHLNASSGTPNITSTAGEFVYGGGALNLDQSGTQEHLALTVPITGFDGSTPWSMAWWGQRSTSALGSQGMIAGTIADSRDFVWTPDNPAVVQGLRLRDSANVNADFGGIVDDQAFHHWAFAYDGAGSVTVWRDNLSLGSLPFSGDVNLTHVGAGTATINNSFFGQIDELYIFDEAIDASTVNQLFNGVPEPGTFILLCLGSLTMLRRRR